MMTFRRIMAAVAVALTVALAATGQAFADDKGSKAGPTDDRDFVSKAAICGSTDVALARMAQQRAGNPEVKNFALRVFADHSAANQQIMALAGRKQVTVPPRIDEKHQECVDRLAKLQGAEFDREYMKAMVKDHEAAVALYRGETQTGRDADIKALATQNLPKLEEHLKEAQRVWKAVEHEGSTSPGGAESSKK
jgi:putative membrane protein